MYNLLTDFTTDDVRTKVTLTAKGREEFRKSVASSLFILAVLIWGVVALVTSNVSLVTAQTNLHAQQLEIAANDTNHLKVALTKLQ